MKKLALACAALATIAIGLPSVAMLRSSAFVLAATGACTEMAAITGQAVSFAGREPSTATTDMTAVCTVVGTKIVGSAP